MDTIRDAGSDVRDRGETSIPDADLSQLDTAGGADIVGEVGVPPDANYHGIVRFVQTPEAAGAGPMYSVLGFFTRGPYLLLDDCSVHREGNCRLTDCKIEPYVEHASAGAVEVSSPRASTRIEPSSTKLYRSSAQKLLWKPGEDVAVRAEGDELSAFEMTLTGPSRVRLKSPDIPSSDEPLVVRTDRDLTVEWTAASDSDALFLAEFAGDGEGRATRMKCTWNLSRQNGQIPRSLLRRIGRTNSGYLFAAVDIETVEFAPWRVDVSLEEAVVDTDDSADLGSGDLQLTDN